MSPQIASIVGTVYRECDIVFLQEAAGSFATGETGALLAADYHILQPARIDTKRDQNSIILMRNHVLKDPLNVVDISPSLTLDPPPSPSTLHHFHHLLLLSPSPLPPPPHPLRRVRYRHKTHKTPARAQPLLRPPEVRRRGKEGTRGFDEQPKDLPPKDMTTEERNLTTWRTCEQPRRCWN